MKKKESEKKEKDIIDKSVENFKDPENEDLEVIELEDNRKKSSKK